MEKIQLLQTLFLCGSAFIGFISVLVLFIKILIKKLKRGEVTAEELTDYTTLLLQLITKAEGFTNWTGDEKKNYVLSNVMATLLRNGAAYDEEAVGEDVDKLIDFSKNVNAKETKKETQRTL